MYKILFAFAGLVLVMSSCGSKETPKKDTTTTVEKRDLKGLKIAFYYNDSLKTQFEYFKTQEAIITKKQKAFESEVQRRTNEYQSFITRNNDKLRNGQLSEIEAQQIQQKAQQMEGALMQYQQNEGMRLEKESFEKSTAINKKIESLGKEFSEKNNIDILLMHGPGGQINFVNPSMDVTTEFVNFLNERQIEIEKDLK
jgi:Skp family chaperone for outer membrane proteins